jgi:acyl-CoA thioester hydrolase
MAAVEQHIVYARELLPGDVVSVTTRVLEVKEKSIRFEHEMTNVESGEVAARTTLKGVHIDTTLRRACALAPAVRDRAAALLLETKEA